MQPVPCSCVDAAARHLNRSSSSFFCLIVSVIFGMGGALWGRFVKTALDQWIRLFHTPDIHGFESQRHQIYFIQFKYQVAIETMFVIGMRKERKYTNRGWIGKEVASDARDPRFESIHSQFFFTKQKEALYGHFKSLFLLCSIMCCTFYLGRLMTEQFNSRSSDWLVVHVITHLWL